MEDAERLLKGSGIIATPQRIAILDYLRTHGDHPSVEIIYEALLPSIPSLSRTTVYNTLTLFRDRGLVFELPIDPDLHRYDIELHLHGHFKCRNCGTISHFPVSLSSYEKALGNYNTDQQTVVFYGICPPCQQALKE